RAPGRAGRAGDRGAGDRARRPARAARRPHRPGVGRGGVGVPRRRDPHHECVVPVPAVRSGVPAADRGRARDRRAGALVAIPGDLGHLMSLVGLRRARGRQTPAWLATTIVVILRDRRKAMTRSPDLTSAELRVMKALWEVGTGTVAEVRSALGRRGQELAYTTVMTLLGRLAAKPAVLVDKT